MNFSRKIPTILFVIDGLEFGGGERVFLQLVANLRHRFKMYVAAGPGKKFESAVKELHIDFCPVEMRRRISIQPILQLKRIIVTKHVDLIHSQGARADFFARIAGKISGNPYHVSTLAMPVEGFDVSSLRKKIYGFLDRLTARYVQRFIVVSSFLENMMIQSRGLDPSRLVKIYNGIELQYYRPEYKEIRIRKEYGISQKAFLIGAVGRMVWQKGFKYLIQSIPDVVRKLPGATFIFVGGGPLRNSLEKLAESLGVRKNVVFAGHRDDIVAILSAVDMVVVPSLLEGFPMVILEAMAMAKPIVATSIPGINEQLTGGENGILVPPNDSEALSKAIISIYNDRELADEMGLAARKRVEKEFSVEKMISETENVYKSLLETV